jgi:hypothetical protein
MEGIVVSGVGGEYGLEVGGEAVSRFLLSLESGYVCLKEGRGEGFVGQNSLCRAPEEVRKEVRDWNFN